MFSLEKCVAWFALRNRPQLRNTLVRCKRGAAALMASFSPSGLRFGVRVRIRVRARVGGSSSTSSTASVSADSSVLHQKRHKLCGHKATPQRYYVATYAVSTAVGNAMPCYRTLSSVLLFAFCYLILFVCLLLIASSSSLPGIFFAC